MQSGHQFNPSNIQYSPRSKRLKSSGSGGKFSQQEVDITNTPLYFAEGFEKIFLAIYFISLPYIAGLLFLFFYISEGKYKVFLSLNKDSSFILTWAIGYEIIAVLTLLYIIKSAISFTRENARKGKHQKFVIP